ncbi:MAG: sulfotransferase family protein [Phycisphaerales bacterium]
MSPAAPAAGIAPPPIAFITGCGRSGTTILGQLLAQRSDVTYLNDRFDLWIDFPIGDIWGRSIAGLAPTARVALTAADAPPDARDRFLACLESHRAGRAVIIEKLAINNFRLPFLRAIVPDAPIINIVRHGIEVAFSIQERANVGRWYGRDDRKWSALLQHAHDRGLGTIADRCSTPFDRGLLEWRLSVDAADEWLAAEHPARFTRLRYEDLLDDPLRACGTLDAALSLSPSPAMRAFAREQLARRSPPAAARAVPDSAEAIAGDTLRRLGYWADDSPATPSLARASLAVTPIEGSR